MNLTENESNDITKLIGKKFLINEWRDTTLQKVSGIYKIINKVNGKYYVGSSKNIFERWNIHLRDLNKGNHHSDYLQRSWNKYKSDKFVFEIVELVSYEKLKETEQNYLNKAFICENAESTYNASANSTGGTCLPEIINKIKSHWTIEKRKTHAEKCVGNKNHFYGNTHNDVTKHILSEKHTGKILSNEHRAKISKSNMGLIPWNKGKPLTETQKESFKKMGEKQCGDSNPNADLTIFYFLNEDTGEIFTGTRCSFKKKFNINPYGLISGMIKKSRNGWTVKPSTSSLVQPTYQLE
jgi:group I intron endonuclease